MNNPIQVFEKIRDNFILYLETAFGTRYPDFEEERNALMKRDKVFARAPWVEPLPTYKPSDFTIEGITNIPNLNDSELAIFKRIVSAGKALTFQPLFLYVRFLATVVGVSPPRSAAGPQAGRLPPRSNVLRWQNVPQHLAAWPAIPRLPAA